MKRIFPILLLPFCLCLVTKINATDHDGVPPLLINFVKMVEDGTLEDGKKTTADFVAQVTQLNAATQANHNTLDQTDNKAVYTQERPFDKYAQIDLRKDIMDKIYFNQHIGGSSTSILLSPIRVLPEWCTEDYRIVKAYFVDGTEEVLDEAIDSENDSFLSLQATKEVKEIQLKARASFPFDAQIINLDAKNNTKKVEDDQITFTKVNDNCVTIAMPKRYRLLELQAQDGMNNFLKGEDSSKTIGMPFDIESKFYTDLQKDLAEKNKKVEKNKYKSKEALLSDCKKLTAKYKGLISDNNVYITTFFHGNVDRVTLDVTSVDMMETVDFLIYPESTK